ncbi:MAG: hypothetical protein KI791_20690 [Cyclobacteriaceae bacterium]|nr:hypothetical protein [Cyclobacteriaceae bacterium SS2]
MKRAFSYFITLFLVFQVSAQFIEFGAGLGTFNYLGDLNSYPRLGQSGFGGQALYKLNFTEYATVRFSLAYGQVRGNDENPVDALAQERVHSFNQDFFELGTIAEYHFLDFRGPDTYLDWSPYVFMGFGILKLGNPDMTKAQFSELQPVIPMGLGLKKMIGKQFCLGLETGARKTFFDYLDGICDSEQIIKDYQYGDPVTNDWYFFTSISLTYVMYEIPCPFSYRPNKSLFSR